MSRGVGAMGLDRQCVWGHADAAMLTLGGAGLLGRRALLRRMGARGGSGRERTAAVGKRWIWSTGASVRCALSWATRRAAVEDMATGGERGGRASESGQLWVNLRL